jgi:hypothetical protein
VSPPEPGKPWFFVWSSLVLQYIRELSCYELFRQSCSWEDFKDFSCIETRVKWFSQLWSHPTPGCYAFRKQKDSLWIKIFPAQWVLEDFKITPLIFDHKVHPAYTMMNAGRAGVFNRVPTLCNQLLAHLLADILQTLHNCYGHIEDVHVTFWECSDIFRKIYM